MTLALRLAYLPRAARSGIMTPMPKAALRYADRLFADHHAVDDALWEQLRARVTDDELLELT